MSELRSLDKICVSTGCDVFVKKKILTCRKHKNFNIQTLPSECSICFDGGTLRVSKCHHVFHYNCLKKMNDPRCPVCRENLNLPLKLKDRINENRKMYKKEQVAEESERIQQEFEELTRSGVITSFLVRNFALLETSRGVMVSYFYQQ